MKPGSAILVLFSALVFPCVAAGQTGGCPADAKAKHVVVTVAIDDYARPERFPHLDSPVPDADAVENKLVKKFGYQSYVDLAKANGIVDVVPLRNQSATRDAINGVPDNLRNVLCEKDDLIFFFSGHGTFRPDREDPTKPTKGYIVPYDAFANGFDGARLVGVKELLGDLNSLPVKHLLVILDACHSGIALMDALEGLKDVSDDARAQLSEEEREKRKSRRVIVSALWNQTAADRIAGGNSLFAGTLLQALDGAAAGQNAYLDDDDIGNFLKHNISGVSNSPQTSDHASFGDHDGGSLVLRLDQDQDRLYEAAFASLIGGHEDDFQTDATEAIQRDPGGARALALSYRLALTNGDVESARESIDKLYQLSRKSPAELRGTRFRDLDELRTARNQLAFWKDVLKMSKSPGKAPMAIHAFTGKTERKGDITQLSGSGDYTMPSHAENLWFKLKPVSGSMYVYAFMIDAGGRIHSKANFVPIRLNPVAPIDGYPQFEQLSTLQYAPNPDDFEEWHIIFSPHPIDAFDEPPSETSTGGDPPAASALTDCFHYVAYVRPGSE